MHIASSGASGRQGNGQNGSREHSAPSVRSDSGGRRGGADRLTPGSRSHPVELSYGALVATDGSNISYTTSGEWRCLHLYCTGKNGRGVNFCGLCGNRIGSVGAAGTGGRGSALSGRGRGRGPRGGGDRVVGEGH